MKKLCLLAFILLFLSSCSSIFYTNRNSNNTFSINSNVKNFEVNFPKLNNTTYVTSTGNLTRTLPKLNSKYTTLEIKSKNYETQYLKLKRSVRPIPLLLDILSFPLTFGIPILIDVFKSDFYKISDVTKNNSITLVNTQTYMMSQFNQIKETRNSEVLDRFIADYPFFNRKEYVIALRDSLEFTDALNSYNESNITKFIQNRPTSKYIPNATRIEAEFIVPT